MLFEFYLLIYLRVAVCSTHLYLCLHARPCACTVCRSKANARCFPLLFSTSVFETESLSDPGANRAVPIFYIPPCLLQGIGRPNLRPILVQQWAISLLGHLHSSKKDFKKEKVWLPCSLYFLSCQCLFVLLIIPTPWREAVGLLSASTLQSDVFACDWRHPECLSKVVLSGP